MTMTAEELVVLQALMNPKPQPKQTELTDEQKRDIHHQLYETAADMPQQPKILLDFDNTISSFKWPGIDSYDAYSLGLPLVGAKELVEGLVKIGTVVIHTQRMNFEALRVKHPARERLRHKIQTWLKDHEFPMVDVLLHPHPFCVVYIGDETLNPLDYLNRTDELLAKVRQKCSAFGNDKALDDSASHLIKETK